MPIDSPVDLASFKPDSAEDLLKGILSHVIPVLGDFWSTAKDEMEDYIGSVSQASYRTMKRLAAGEISREKADLLFHSQELALNNVLLYAEFLTYDLAQEVLDTVFSVLMAAVRNSTGIALNF